VVRVLLASAAIATGAFARRVHDRKVRLIGRRFAAGERTPRRGGFACEGCGATVVLDEGALVPVCPACGSGHAVKTS
jgi:DNA-directed RNA polymerase subunit RPC12/RpoP